MADISRRQLFTGAAGLAVAGGLAACSSSSSPSTSPTQAAAKPKRGGKFRLGVTGGGAKDIIDGQTIITKPDQARLVTAWETLLIYDDNYKLGTDGLAEEVTQDNPEAVDDPARAGHRVQQRQDARPTTSSTRSSASRPRRTASSAAPPWPPSTSRASRRWTS